jgi:hypothetical protein
VSYTTPDLTYTTEWQTGAELTVTGLRQSSGGVVDNVILNLYVDANMKMLELDAGITGNSVIVNTSPTYSTPSNGNYQMISPLTEDATTTGDKFAIQAIYGSRNKCIRLRSKLRVCDRC